MRSDGSPSASAGGPRLLGNRSPSAPAPAFGRDSRRARRRLAKGLVVLAALVAPLSARADAGQLLSADAWISRMSGALRMRTAMAATARLSNRDSSGQERASEIEWLRLPESHDTLTLLEVRDTESQAVQVSRIAAPPAGPLTAWIWFPERRRFVKLGGILATDAFAGTVFRYEDLAFVEPVDRKRGSVRMTRRDGRTLVVVDSKGYHYYARVVTTLDAESALPRRVVFYDRAGLPFREQRFEAVQTIGSRPFPTRIRIHDFLTRQESLLEFHEIRFGVSLSPSLFDLSGLELRLRKGLDAVPLPEVLHRPDRLPPG